MKEFKWGGQLMIVNVTWDAVHHTCSMLDSQEPESVGHLFFHQVGLAHLNECAPTVFNKTIDGQRE